MQISEENDSQKSSSEQDECYNKEKNDKSMSARLGQPAQSKYSKSKKMDKNMTINNRTLMNLFMSPSYVDGPQSQSVISEEEDSGTESDRDQDESHDKAKGTENSRTQKLLAAKRDESQAKLAELETSEVDFSRLGSVEQLN